jgi:hypothetical protein
MAVTWGDAGAGDDAGGADAPRADADLDGVGAALDEGQGPLLGGHVAHHQLDLREALAQSGRGVEHAAAVGVRGVEHEEIDLGLDQGRGALQVVAVGADRRAHAQPPELVLAGARVLDRLLDVLDRDQPLEVAVPVDDQHLLDAVLVELGLGLLQGRPLRDGDQVLLGHQLGDRLVRVRLEAEVAVGEDADQMPFGAGHRHARDLVEGHHVERLADALVGAHGDGIDDHPRLTALDPVHLLGLGLDGEVLVDDADPPLLGQGDGQARLGHRVHGRGEDGDVHLDPAADLGAQIHLVRMDLGETRDQRDVVEREGEARLEVGHRLLQDGAQDIRSLGSINSYEKGGPAAALDFSVPAALLTPPSPPRRGTSCTSSPSRRGRGRCVPPWPRG